MSRKVHVKPSHDRSAQAPYNFVPLPDRVIDTREQFGNPEAISIDLALPDHNCYFPQPERFSGYFDVRLTTESLLYIRAPRTPNQVAQDTQSAAFFYNRDPQQPVIPGSSLRGMLRNMVEIITYSKMDPVSSKQASFYRAVAAKQVDPLKSSYEKVIGEPLDGFGAKVKAGYLIEQEGTWFIVPAQQIQGKAFVKVKDDKEFVGDVHNLKCFNDQHYQVQYHPVVYEVVRLRKGNASFKVRSPKKGERATGHLVCSGNMNETGGAKRSKRSHYVLIGVYDEAEIKRALPIAPEAIEAYKTGLSPYQQQPPFDSKMGWLKDLHPVFYISTGNRVIYFGHTPYFRIPATRIEGGKLRVTTLQDFVPPELRDHSMIDMTEALFGFVRPQGDGVSQGDKRHAYAGRISVIDAILESNQTNLFEKTFIPKVMGTPKPTTFQHYLVQKTDKLPQLQHYESNTEIRGHKLYWRQRQTQRDGVEIDPEKMPKGEMKPDPITPLRPGISFRFRVHFDNLTKIEVGALAWALALPAQNYSTQSPYRHMLGMGKAFGMGVIQLEPTLYLIDRQQRYQYLFSENNLDWELAIKPTNWEEYASDFEQFIVEHLGKSGRLHEVERIEMLLTMLKGRKPHSKLQHMTIEPNQFKDRKVLPDPKEVAKTQLDDTKLL